jgi:hypothetical protein
VGLLADLLEHLDNRLKRMQASVAADPTPRRLEQQQRLLQGGMLVSQAALSLLLTTSKVPRVMQCAEVCACLAKCIIRLQDSIVTMADLKRQQQQQQQQQQQSLPLPPQLQQEGQQQQASPQLPQQQEGQQQLPSQLPQQQERPVPAKQQQASPQQGQHAGIESLLPDAAEQDSRPPDPLRIAPQLELQRAVLVLACRGTAADTGCC